MSEMTIVATINARAVFCSCFSKGVTFSLKKSSYFVFMSHFAFRELAIFGEQTTIMQNPYDPLLKHRYLDFLADDRNDHPRFDVFGFQ